MKQVGDQENMQIFGQNWPFFQLKLAKMDSEHKFSHFSFLPFWYPNGVFFMKKLGDQENMQIYGQNWPFFNLNYQK